MYDTFNHGQCQMVDSSNVSVGIAKSVLQLAVWVHAVCPSPATSGPEPDMHVLAVSVTASGLAPESAQAQHSGVVKSRHASLTMSRPKVDTKLCSHIHSSLPNLSTPASARFPLSASSCTFPSFPFSRIFSPSPSRYNLINDVAPNRLFSFIICLFTRNGSCLFRLIVSSASSFSGIPVFTRSRYWYVES